MNPESMHIHTDRPHGVQTPRCQRRLIKYVNGDTLGFIANLKHPSTGEPLEETDDGVTISIVLSENRFNPPIWKNEDDDGSITFDDDRKGMVHIKLPKAVMSTLRRGVYSFSVAVDDGTNRETQLAGNIQVEYEPTSTVRNIPYRND